LIIDLYPEHYLAALSLHDIVRPDEIFVVVRRPYTPRFYQVNQRHNTADGNDDGD